MEFVTISFPNLSQMAYFIMDCGLSDFVPNWNEASLTGYVRDSHLKTAFEKYDACILQREGTGNEGFLFKLQAL